jgi:para-nitrobenzyl esterase
LNRLAVLLVACTPSNRVIVPTLILLGVAIAHAAAAPSVPIIATEYGWVAGVNDSGRLVFKGVPYAAPPVGQLRWRAPRAFTRWRGVRAAQSFAPICMQPPATPGSVANPQVQSEDCLYLNIWRPAGDARGLPVLFWIPGGGFVAGSGTQPMYDGRALADRGVIVVTINYRVGRFGFFAHPLLTKENRDQGRLYNYGLMDQIAALQWVSRNIQYFGGEPTRVTIFGESAGGASVDALMIAPAARGLFAAAISQSGYGRGSFLRIQSRSADGDVPAENIGLAIATRLGMPRATLAQLRAVPATHIAALFNRNDEHVLAVDGVSLTSDLWPAFERGEEAPVPLIIGSNSYEMGAMDPKDQRPWAERVIPRERWNSLTSFYGDEPTRNRLILSDITFTSQARALADRHRRNGHPTYLYYFDVAPASTGSEKPRPGAPHAFELAYVFGNFGVRPDATLPPDNTDRRVSRELMSYWTRLATFGNPNGGALPPWPSYDGASVLHIRRDVTALRADPMAARVAALNTASIDTVPAAR